jgi:hypothetical protein
MAAAAFVGEACASGGDQAERVPRAWVEVLSGAFDVA